jgi:nucleotide-binding universal stress UspA family protein
MSRILLAISTPVAARRLVEPIGDLARRLAAEVLVVHVCRPSAGQMREQEQSGGEESLSVLRDELTRREIAVQTLLLFSDDISRAILTTAVERQASLIVLGLTTKNVFARLLAGNVPVELIKSATVPVLLVPPDWTGTV